MGFFSNLFGNGGNEEVQANGGNNVIQTEDRRCVFCNNIKYEYDYEGNKCYYCTAQGENLGKANDPQVVYDMEYSNRCSGYRFEKYYPEDATTLYRNPIIDD